MIPVLFIAITLEGRYLQSLGAVISHTADEIDGVGSRSGRLRTIIKIPLLASLVSFLMVAGGLGEFLAVLALYFGADGNGLRVLVLISTLVLVAGVVVGAYMSLSTASSGHGKPVARRVDSGPGTDQAKGPADD